MSNRNASLNCANHPGRQEARAAASERPGQLEQEPERPLLLVDVDGVISLFGFDPASPPAGIWQSVDGVAHLLSATAGAHLRRLSTAFEPAWCTGWEEKADEYLPHALELPDRFPHVSFAGAIPAVDGHWKLAAIDRYAGRDRPVAWVDDAHDARCRVWAEARPGPTRLLTTDPARGLTETEVDELLRWAQAQAAATENTGGSRVATVDHVAPASPEPNTSPDVAPK